MRLPWFVNGHFESRSLKVDAERCINLIPDVQESPGATVRAALYGTPGLATFATLTQGPVRTLYRVPHYNRVFAVGGSVLFEVFADGHTIARDSMVNDPRPATIAFNGLAANQLALTSGGQLYIYHLTSNTLTMVLPDIARVAYLDTFFLALDNRTHQVRVSESNDGLTWDPTQVAERQGAGDPAIAMIVANGQVLLLGEDTGELWYNAGAAPYPLLPIPGASFPVGIAAPYTLLEVQGHQHSSVLWLGRNAQGQAIVYRLRGYTPEPISPFALTRAIQQYPVITDAVAWTYQEGGRVFYLLNFPTAGATWAIDLQTLLCHERPYWNVNARTWEAGRPQCACVAFGKYLVGDRASGQIFELSTAHVRDADGAVIRRIRRCPVIANEHVAITHYSFELDLEAGLGPTTATPALPAVILADGPGHYWPCDESAGATTLSDRGTRPTAPGSVGLVPPTFETAVFAGLRGVTFAGVNDQQIDLVGVQPSSDTFSLVAVFVPDSAQTDAEGILLRGVDFYWKYQRTTRLMAVERGAATVVSHTPLVDGEPVLVAFVSMAGTGTFYLDGVADGTVTGVPSWLLHPPDRIGAQTATSYRLKGTLAQLAFYPDVALTPAQLLTYATARRQQTLRGPTALLRWSDDGGKTWSEDREMDAGVLGAYSWRLMADRLGESRERLYEVEINAPTDVRILDAYLNGRQGRF